MRPKGFKHSEETKRKISSSNLGVLSSQWKGGGATYAAFHSWLTRNYGKADRCENRDCPGISQNFEWALLKGKLHDHKRNNYKRMCRSCHRKYDEINKKKI